MPRAVLVHEYPLPLPLLAAAGSAGTLGFGRGAAAVSLAASSVSSGLDLGNRPSAFCVVCRSPRLGSFGTDWATSLLSRGKGTDALLLSGPEAGAAPALGDVVARRASMNSRHVG